MSTTSSSCLLRGEAASFRRGEPRRWKRKGRGKRRSAIFGRRSESGVDVGSRSSSLVAPARFSRQQLRGACDEKITGRDRSIRCRLRCSREKRESEHENERERERVQAQEGRVTRRPLNFFSTTHLDESPSLSCSRRELGFSSHLCAPQPELCIVVSGSRSCCLKERARERTAIEKKREKESNDAFDGDGCVFFQWSLSLSRVSRWLALFLFHLSFSPTRRGRVSSWCRASR